VSTTLARIDEAKRAIALASKFEDVVNIRDKMAAMKVYMQSVGESLDLQNRAAEMKLRAERKAGEMLSVMSKNEGSKNKGKSGGDIVSPPKIEELGVTKKQSSRWQDEAKVPEDKFEAWIESTVEQGEELTQAGLLRLAKGKTHVSNNSGNNEWYTPSEYIEPYRIMVGVIDVDPASCVKANEVVKARKFYDESSDGLSKKWNGSVWLNPPYESGLVDKFGAKLFEEMAAERTTSACVLVNNATETKWAQLLIKSCSSCCFLSSRIKFWNESGVASSPLQGQMLLYFGADAGLFAARYRSMGVVMGNV
jgi:hypothetical protein